jgi:hypothetical protein
MAAALLLAASGAGAQPKDANADGAFAPFKGKLKEGLYEIKTDHDMSGVPGIPKEHAKGSETKQRCVSRQELDRGVRAGKDCKIASAKESGNSANVRMECKDGAVTDMKIALTGNGYATEMTTTGKQDGKAFNTSIKSQTRYLGPCPK